MPSEPIVNDPAKRTPPKNKNIYDKSGLNTNSRLAKNTNKVPRTIDVLTILNKKFIANADLRISYFLKKGDTA
ncbi:hypothetical protein [Nostoc sp.]|uniref:hypothetical protein n=1 Tax=Nostoc sp. TaxID=1180 RepID=UPI002FF876D8